MRSPNQFIDPNGVVPTYNWPLNHETEDTDSAGKVRNITYTAPTGHVGLVKEINDTDPFILSWSGSIFLKSQLVAMWQWFQLCERQTIFVQDFAGEKYEVIILQFKPARVRVARNTHDPANAPNHIWTYKLQMSVLNILAGALADAGVTV